MVSRRRGLPSCATSAPPSGATTTWRPHQPFASRVGRRFRLKSRSVSPRSRFSTRASRMSWSTSRRAALATVRARPWVAASTSCQFQVMANPFRSRYSIAAAGRRAKMARRSASVGAAISRSGPGCRGGGPRYRRRTAAGGARPSGRCHPCPGTLRRGRRVVQFRCLRG